jgi:hypothetical protein
MVFFTIFPPSKMKRLVWLVALSISGDQLVHAAPMTVNGVPFTLVATGPGTAQLFGLTSDTQGSVYIGNNSNTTTGIPVQLFKPSLFSGSPISLQNFGPAVGDADGLAFGGGYIYAPDQNEGLRRTLIPGGTSSVFLAGKSINGTGSPVVYRPSDGHVFIGFGSTVPGVPGAKRIDEYNSSGIFVHTFTTVAETETMTFDSASGLIYYAAFGSEVRAFNPLTSTDSHIGNTSGFIDGGLALDPITGLLFVGTANGSNSGLVETINPGNANRTLFASGFNGCLGILREPVSGDLYFLETNQLYRLSSAAIQVRPLFNISTRLNVGTGSNVLIGGVIVQGTGSKTILFRALGPTLGQFSIPNAMANPTLELHATDNLGNDVVLAFNDNWKDSQQAEISATGKAPPNDLEAAILRTLSPGQYTVILRGKNNTTGVGLVEAYDASPSNGAELANISSRGLVGTGANVMIGGFIVEATARFLTRGLGPTLAAPPFNVPGTLADPTLELHNGNGDLLASDDDWQTDGQANQIPANWKPPKAKESALLRTLTPGNYTAILSGKNNTTGVALIEVYNLDAP